MPTKHIDAGQWRKIEDLTLVVTRLNNNSVREGEMLKYIIERGLSGITAQQVSGHFVFQPRVNVVLIQSSASHSTITAHYERPTPDELLDVLDTARPYILCLYGKTGTGRSTLARQLTEKVAGGGTETVVFDDAGEAEVAAAWQDFRAGRRAVVVLAADNLMNANNQLFQLQSRTESTGEPPTLHVSADGQQRSVMQTASEQARLAAQWQTALKARADDPFVEKDGYVVICGQVCTGWTLQLDSPQSYEPGCVAFDGNGKAWIACGGDAYNGAQEWLIVNGP